MTLQLLLERLTGLQKVANGWMAKCPAHPDRKASLSVREGAGGKILVHCFAGCSTRDVVAAFGMKMEDLFPGDQAHALKQNAAQGGKIVTVYDYRNESGVLLFQTVRYKPKDFRQRRPDPKSPGSWIWNLQGVRRVLYRLPEVLAARE